MAAMLVLYAASRFAQFDDDEAASFTKVGIPPWLHSSAKELKMLDDSGVVAVGISVLRGAHALTTALGANGFTYDRKTKFEPLPFDKGTFLKLGAFDDAPGPVQKWFNTEIFKLPYKGGRGAPMCPYDVGVLLAACHHAAWAKEGARASQVAG